MESASVNYPCYQSYAISMNVDYMNFMKFQKSKQIQTGPGG